MPVRRAVATLAAVALCLAACSTTHHAASTTTAVQVSVSACGHGWSATHAGPQALSLQNSDSAAGEVDVIAPRTGAIYADVEPIGPGTTVALNVTLGPGTYALRCAMEDEATVVGPAVTLTGSTTGAAPGVLPVDQAQLVPYAKAYERSVSAALPGLSALVARLRTDVAAGDLPRARADWVPAHQAYERLGAAYDAFGDLDAKINGASRGLPGGVTDPNFTGFHRIEYGLWHGASAATVLSSVDTLTHDVDALRQRFATAQIDPLQISIRAHEISENAVQFELTGEDDYGSHSELATVAANLDGTTTVLAIIRPLLIPRDRSLGATDAQLARARQLVDAQQHDGQWTALTSLAPATREAINAAMSELCEQLATVASILEPRMTS